MSILNNENRIGNFTSSEIYNLLSEGTRDMTAEELAAHKLQFPKSTKKKTACWPGEAAVSYIIEKRMERRLKQAIGEESAAKSLSWGKCMERYAFANVGLEYMLISQETKKHPKYPFWAGSADATKGDTVCDFKAPFSKKSFCQLVSPLYDGLTGMDAMNALRNGYESNGLFHKAHKDGEKFYWQLISNAAIFEKEYAELIIFMPTKSYLDEILKMEEGNPDTYFMSFANENELPFLKNEGYYNSMNVIRFKVPESDNNLLERRVQQSESFLTNTKVITISGDVINGSQVLITE